MKQKLQVIVHVARGLGHLHDNGICHKDCKPDNVLLKRVATESCGIYTFVAKIGDLELSKVIPEGSAEPSTCVKGSLPYLDPHYVDTW